MRLSLNGKWLTHRHTGLKFAYPPPQDGWEAQNVPHAKAKFIKYDWKMTEYKLNEMFAEKRVNEKTIFTTIKFFEGTLTFSNASEAKDLFNAVKKEFSSKTTSH